MAKYCIPLFLLAFCNAVLSQSKNTSHYSVYVSTGFTYSKADFYWGENKTEKNYSPISNTAFNLGLSRKMYDYIDLNMELGFKSYGAKYSEEENLSTLVSLNYLDLSVIATYKINLSKRSKLCCGTNLGYIYPLIGVGLYSSFLLDGYQTKPRGGIIDVVRKNVIDRFDFGIVGDIGMGLLLTNKVRLITKIRLNYGLYNIEGVDKQKNQSSFNRAIGLFAKIVYGI